jgi:hypothetical protein
MYLVKIIYQKTLLYILLFYIIIYMINNMYSLKDTFYQTPLITTPLIGSSTLTPSSTLTSTPSISPISTSTVSATSSSSSSLESATSAVSSTTSLLQYRLVNKQCWIDNHPRAISESWLDLRIGTPQTIYSADKLSRISITVPANLVMQSNQVGNLTYTDLERYNEWALSIAIQHGFDTIGYQASWALFFGKYNTNYNNITYNYDKYGRLTDSTCFPFGYGMINNVYIVELISELTTPAVETTTSTSLETTSTSTPPTSTSLETTSTSTPPTSTSTSTPPTSTSTSTTTSSTSRAVETTTTSRRMGSDTSMVPVATTVSYQSGISLISGTEILVSNSLLSTIDSNIYTAIDKLLKKVDSKIEYDTRIQDNKLFILLKPVSSNMESFESTPTTTQLITSVIIVLNERDDLKDSLLKVNLSADKSDKGLSKFDIAGIVIMSLLVFIVIVLLVVFFVVPYIRGKFNSNIEVADMP